MAKSRKTPRGSVSDSVGPPGDWPVWRKQLHALYYGRSDAAEKFRLGLLFFDIFSIVFFIVQSFLTYDGHLHLTELVLGTLFLAEYVARIAIEPNRLRFAFTIGSLADLIVIVSLLAPPLVENYAFLRVLRTLRLLRSYRAIVQLRDRYDFFRRNEEVVVATVNLFVFIFVVTALVYITQHEQNDQISNYVDALYFSVTALSTTGFGDIILIGTEGRLLAVLIMIFGISLFLRLIQTLFRPSKVHFECPDCGLLRHDADAVHCKHCGALVHIDTEGD